jgi:hypothetical protein
MDMREFEGHNLRVQDAQALLHGQRGIFRARISTARKGLSMTEHAADDASSVEGKDIRGNVVTLRRTSPEQLSLFQTFLPDDDKYSNTIELYDAIPKYYPLKHMGPLRVGDTFLRVLTREFEYRGEAFKLTIRPARIVYKDGSEQEFYPSFREEIVEEALRKIACDHLNGVFLNEQAGVQFTLYELQKELKARGHGLNLQELLESLKICNLASITVEKAGGMAIIQSTIFPVLLIASKEDWLKNPKQARCYVQFNPLVTASINRLSYRQYDYLTYMAYKHRLSRWLHKRLAHNYVQASMLNPYTINLTTILRDSGAYHSPRGHNRTREVGAALHELKSKGVIMSFKEAVKRGPRNKIIDVTYTLLPDFSFVDEVKKANTRSKRTHEAFSSQRRLLSIQGKMPQEAEP